ncbi:flagellar hook-length control protein FliK, partial [Roseococcus sp. DSY-14]|uniref:flagellar hook-length control protein FliK n=1 Tax=Roseococcus sp. DSY-14 TaxID=3369650 RepID=UPI00387B52A0
APPSTAAAPVEAAAPPRPAEAPPPVRAEAPAAAPPPAARQVAQTAIALSFAPGPQGGFTLQLEPAELGRVEITLRREGDRHALSIAAERPETLLLLRQDRAELDRALGEAGVRLDGAASFALTGGGADGSGGGGGGAPGGRGGRPAAPAEALPPPRAVRGLLDLAI